MWENSRACNSLTTSRHSREVSSTLALSTLVTFVRAAPKAVRAMRSISAVVYAHTSEAEVAGTGLLAEVDPARQLAHDEQVCALDPLALAAARRRTARAAA